MGNPSTGRPAGRPKGSMSKIAEAAREAAKQTGLLPHEILLSMARGEAQRADVVDPTSGKITGATWLVPDIDQRKDAAKGAAPYYAPRISTVEVIQGISDADLDAAIERIAAEAGYSLTTGGEGEEEEDPPAPRGRRCAD